MRSQPRTSVHTNHWRASLADRKITHLFLDTSYLRAVGFKSPDFQKVLKHAQAKRLQVLVPHVAWEEWRTQLLEEPLKMVRDLRAAYEKLVSKMAGDHFLNGLERPVLVLWPDNEVDGHSKKSMQVFAANNGIEVVKMDVDHAERAWGRYFTVAPPFNSVESRVNRRKDIPDSWILEAAIDLKAQYPNLRALCCDEALSDALNVYEIETHYGSPVMAGEITRTFLEQLEADLVPPAPAVQDIPAEPGTPIEPPKEPELAVVLAEAQREFKDLEVRVLGFVTYLETPTKEQLFRLLERSGVPVEMARNVAERLVFAKLIVDTGNHYLPGDKQAGERAVALVEPEIIKLLENGA
jgi:hypothetical protein